MINLIILIIGVNIWIPQQSGTDAELRKVFFITPQTGWVVGQQGLRGIILKTENGGITWNTVYHTDSAPLLGVWFINEYEGWVVGGTGIPGYYLPQIILHTTDGGTTWQRVQNPHPSSNWRTANTVQFINQKGWIGMERSGNFPTYVIHTNDGGNNWVNQPVYPHGSGIISLHFIDTLRGVACGWWNFAYPYANTDGIIWCTLNGGNTWDVAETWRPGEAAIGAFHDIWMVNENIGYATGAGVGAAEYTGIIEKTVSGVYGWDTIRLSSTEEYRGVHFINSQIGWVCGRYGLILFTQDGGNTWSYDISNTDQNLWDIHGVGNYLWAVGDNGTILHLRYVPVEEPVLKIDNPNFSKIKERKYLDVMGRIIKDKPQKGIYFVISPHNKTKIIKIKK